MAVYRVQVEYADGDDFTRRFTSEMDVEASNEMRAMLIANQMAMTPQPGKPAHIQITNVIVIGEKRVHPCLGNVPDD